MVNVIGSDVKAVPFSFPVSTAHLISELSSMSSTATVAVAVSV